MQTVTEAIDPISEPAWLRIALQRIRTKRKTGRLEIEYRDGVPQADHVFMRVSAKSLLVIADEDEAP